MTLCSGSVNRVGILRSLLAALSLLVVLPGLAEGDVHDGSAGDDDTGALTGHADTAGERVGADAGAIADGDPGDLVVALDHPGSDVGGVVDLLEIVSGVHINFRGVGVHLCALVGRGRYSVGIGAGSAVVLGVLEEDALVGAGEEVAGGDGRDAGLRGPLDEVVQKSGGELSDGDGAVFDFDLAGEGRKGGRRLAVGGAEEEAAEDDAVLHIDPDEAAAAEVGAALAGEENVAAIADLDGDLGVREHVVEGVGEGHVASVMEHAVGDGGAEEVFELAVAVEVAGGGTGELVEEGERGGGDGIFEEGFIVGRRRGERHCGLLLRRCLGFVGRGWRRGLLGGRGVGGWNCLRDGVGQQSGGEEEGRQQDSKKAEGRAKGLHGSPFGGHFAGIKLSFDGTDTVSGWKFRCAWCR